MPEASTERDDDLTVVEGAGEHVGRDPDAIAREIEETRAELARAVDLIADRLSPKRAASRGAAKVRDTIDGVFHAETVNGSAPVETPPLEEPASASSITSVPLPEPEMQTVRTLRRDRVAIAVVVGLAVVAFVIRRRRRH